MAQGTMRWPLPAEGWRLDHRRRGRCHDHELPMRPSLLTILLAVGLALTSTGCVKKMMLDAELHAARDASGALDSVADYDTARDIAMGGIGQIEGMHTLA